MNISFIIILFSGFVIILFLKGLFNLDFGGYKKFVWIILFICLSGIAAVSFRFFDLVDQLPHFLYLEIPILFLMCPSLYFLLRNRPRKFVNPERLELVHFLPAVLSFTVLIPFFVLEAKEKSELLLEAPLIIHIINWVWAVQMIAYLLIFLFVLNFFNRTQINWKDNRWYPILSYGIFIVFVLIKILGIADMILLNMLAYFLVAFTVFFYKKANSNRTKPICRSTNEVLLKLLDTIMKEDKLYLESNLSLQDLSQKLGEKPNTVSRVLNQDLRINYNDYINQYRVKEVIHLLQNQENNLYTLEAISEMAGFRSLTTFNAAFKKQTGKTPKEYRRLTKL